MGSRPGMSKPLEGAEADPETEDKLGVEEDRGVTVDGGAEEKVARLKGRRIPTSLMVPASMNEQDSAETS